MIKGAATKSKHIRARFQVKPLNFCDVSAVSLHGNGVLCPWKQPVPERNQPQFPPKYGKTTFHPTKSRCQLVAGHGNYSVSDLNGTCFHHVSVAGPKKELRARERSSTAATRCSRAETTGF